MRFRHSDALWAACPQLAAGVVHAKGITPEADVDIVVAEHTARAHARLASGTEADLPEISAWRRTFSAMGLKPTQYRCASEALLRRLRKEGTLPRLHPLVDLCNAASAASAIPVAAFDLARVTGDLQVRHARGDETFETFSGAIERPDPGEVVFADDSGAAHARRWTNRQSRLSAIGPDTSSVLVVAEAMHPDAVRDVSALISTLAREIARTWSINCSTRLLDRSDPMSSTAP
jgi:DNA/RNA-binding domain of Phe-tRNA-synthetase-like protein